MFVIPHQLKLPVAPISLYKSLLVAATLNIKAFHVLKLSEFMP